MSDKKASTAERLTSALGFDPAKKVTGAGVFKEALKEVTKKRDEANKTKAIELIEKAIGIREKIDAAEKQFLSQKKKFDKELGKLLNGIEAMAKGSEPAAEEEESAE